MLDSLKISRECGKDFYGLQAAIALRVNFCSYLGYLMVGQTTQENIPTLVFIVAAQMKSSIVRCVALIGLVDLPLTRSPLERLERLAAIWVFVVGATCN